MCHFLPATGVKIHSRTYSTIPAPSIHARPIKIDRTMSGSMLKYSANPPQTPAITLFLVER